MSAPTDSASSTSSLKIALVTGSGKRRVGWHVAETLGKAGYALAVHYRSSEQEARATVDEFQARGFLAAAFRADLTREPEVEALVNDVLARFGRLDAFVHCAATWRRRSLESTSANDVRTSWEENTLATFLLGRHVGLAMTAQADGGAIVLCGDWATERPYRDYAAYFSSKGAIPTLTRTMAVELGLRNPQVRVNCILPGPVMLPPDLSEAERRQAINATLVRREGSPDHVARAALHLLENDFITGVCLPVDGGRSIYAPDSV